MSKLSNISLLRQNYSIANHIPYSLTFSKKNLATMLKKYSSVYIKPTNLSQGEGILRVDFAKSYTLRSRDKGTSSKHTTIESLSQKIQQLKLKSSPYFIQQTIESVTKQKKPFDIRTHFIRVDNEWLLAGVVARIAPKTKIVTNAYSGAKSHYLDDLFSDHLGYTPCAYFSTKRELLRLSRLIIGTISRKYPKRTEFGLDIGIDKTGHLWLYEINSKPGTLVFKNLDQNMYYDIIRLRHYAS